MAEARELNHSYVGTEHLLLGLLREEKGLAAKVLGGLGIGLDDTRAETLKLLGTELQVTAVPTRGGTKPRPTCRRKRRAEIKNARPRPFLSKPYGLGCPR